MKTILALMILISLNAKAFEKRTYTKINSSEAEVRIETEEGKATPAVFYADGRENEKFIQDMFTDKKSILYKLKSDIERENCQSSLQGCGLVTLTREVRTSFGNSGQMACGGSYTFFAGFTNDDSGKTFDVSHMVVIAERTEVLTKKNGNHSGVIIKTLNLVKIKRIDELTPFH